MDPLVNPGEIARQAVLLPSAICLGTSLLARTSALLGPRATQAITVAGVAAAFCAAFYAVHGLPALPIGPGEDAWKWVFWFAPAGAAIGVAGPLSRVPESLRLLARIAVGAAAAWLLLHPMVPHAFTAGQALGRAALGGVIVECVWTAIAAAARRGGGPKTGLPLVVAITSASAIILFWGSSLVMAQAAGALAVAVGATVLLQRWRGGRAIPEGAAPVIALAFVGLLVGAHTYLNFGEVVHFPLGTALLLAAAAACVAIPRVWLATGLSLALVAAAALLASRLASRLATEAILHS